MYTITHIQADADTFTLRITYSDGVTINADFKPVLEKDGVMTLLRDPAVFTTVRIGSRGRSIAWDWVSYFLPLPLAGTVERQTKFVRGLGHESVKLKRVLFVARASALTHVGRAKALTTNN
jgi:hypothetical protein